jgi:predicted hydrolase (HD superfamily)
MARALFAVDELTGLVTATALVKPSRSVHDVDVAGVRKRMKDKAFARGVSREDITVGAAALGVPLDEHVAVVIAAMQANAGALGLEGSGGVRGTGVGGQDPTPVTQDTSSAPGS